MSAEQKKNSGKIRGFIVYLIIAFTMILLTSSFIIEGVYNSADKVRTDAEGVKEVYAYSVGAGDFADSQAPETTEEVQPTATVAPTAAPTAEATPAPEATPEATAEPTPSAAQ